MMTLVGCGGGSAPSNAINENLATPRLPVISAQPADATTVLGGTAKFTVTASSETAPTYQWQKNGAAITDATAASYMTHPASMSDDAATFSVIVTNATGSTVSNAAKLTVTASPGNLPPAADVVTFKNNTARNGQNLSEAILTPENVTAATFGLLRKLTTDGKVDAQPLYLSQVSIGGALHNIVFVATEHDSVYAFDADTGATFWQTSLLGSGEAPTGTSFPAYGDHTVTYPCTQTSPEVGITATPVIDRNAGPHGVIYLVAASLDASDNYHQRLHALDVVTGAEVLGAPKEIAATFTTPLGAVAQFDPAQYQERAALLLSNGIIYTSWASHCDTAPYGGWIISFDSTSLANVSALNVAPNGNGTILVDRTYWSSNGPSIWMSGSGPAADSAGNIYLLTANGRFETTLDSNGFPSGGDFANSFLKLTGGSGALGVADYFTMYNELTESDSDQDLGSGGEMLLPDLLDADHNVKHLVVGAGKDGIIYLVDRDSMGKFDMLGNHIWQQVSVLTAGVYSSPAYFNNTIYYNAEYQHLTAHPLSNAKLATTVSSQTDAVFPYPGTSPVVSANGERNGIVWASDNSKPGVLHAYDAGDLTKELYNSNQAANNRDQFGTVSHFDFPVISGGKVFVPATDGLAVFGLLP
jgi:hypothetical protein